MRCQRGLGATLTFKMMQRLNNAIDTSGDTHFLGWDVGGWNCDKNGKSRDATAVARVVGFELKAREI